MTAQNAWIRQAGALVLLVLIGCSGPEKDDPRFLDSASAVPPTEDQEAARLRKMQLVRVVDTTQDPEVVLEISPISFSHRILACETGTLGPKAYCGAQANTACELRTCMVRGLMCQAQIQLAAASGTGAAVVLPYLPVDASTIAEAIQIRVPAQSAATSAALALEAASTFERVMAEATVALTGGCNNLEIETEYTDGISARAFSAANFVEAFESGKHAYRVAYENTLAVSDAELSSSNQLLLARVRAISNPELSRSAAAHLMVGGKAGWFGSTTDAFCTEGRLTGPERAALSVLREAAPHPGDVLSSTVTTDQLVNGTTPNGLSHGSIRARLADAWGTTAIPAGRPVWDAYGLKEGDFEAARKALRDEIEIFGRTRTASLLPRALPGGQMPEFNRFAGTAGPPPDRPNEYWALLALFDAPELSNQLRGTWREPEADEYFDDSLPLGDAPIGDSDSLAGFVDRAYSWAGRIARNPVLSTAEEEVLNPLTLLLSGENLRGRLTHCAFFDGPLAEVQTLRALGYEAADRVTLVRGQDLMDCAVNGHIEGAPCELPPALGEVPSNPTDPQFNPEVIHLATEVSIGIGSFETEVWGEFQGPISGRYYLIRPRQKGDSDPGPGAWELLLGTPLFLDFEQTGFLCRDVPIVPEAIEAAAQAIAPSRDWCGASKVSCAGTRFDERLPLEDELSTDHDDIESSWRHYLTLARTAVEHADALGQEYVEAGLQDDLRDEEVDLRRIQREEQAVADFQRIQEICGSSADPNKILELLGRDADGDLTLENIQDVQPCVTNAANPTSCGMRRVAREHPELGAIAACLAGFGKLEEMHLGDGYLCAANESAILPSSAPRVAPQSECVDDSAAAPDDVGPDTGCADSRYHCIPASDGLGLFDTESLAPEPLLPAICDGVRKLRAKPVEDDAGLQRLYESIVGNVAFSEESMARLKESVDAKLSYDPVLGVAVTVSAGGGEFSSSSSISPRLCGTGTETCPSGTDGLLCRKWNCASASQRAELGLRLYKAAAALGVRRLDTIWYLNHYVAPHGYSHRGSWTLLNLDNRRWLDPAYVKNVAPTGAGLFLGAQGWDLVGDLPGVLDGGPAGTIEHDNNRSMQPAFRRGRVVNWRGLAFELLQRRATGTEGGAVVHIEPVSVGLQRSVDLHEEVLGLGVAPVCLHGGVDPVNPSESLDEGACDLNYTNPDLLPDATTLQLALEQVGLMYFPSLGFSSTSTASEIAPATRRLAALRSGTVFGTQVFPEPPAGNGILTPVELDRQARLDAIELACQALSGNDALEVGCGSQINLQTVDDFDEAGIMLECLGNEMTHRAGTAVYRLPREALEYLKNGERVFDSTGGALALSVSDLRNSLIEAATSGPIIGGTLRRFGQDLRALRAQLARIETSGKINEIQLNATIANQATACVNATAATFTVSNFGGGAVAAAATCANSIAQIGFATQIENLQKEDLKLASDQAIAEFSGRVSDYVTTLETQGLRLSQALEGIQRNLDGIESLRGEAERAMQSAVWHLSRQARNQTQVSTVLDNLKIGKHLRYRRAYDDARKMAFFAKRAIEMRLGMSLAEMNYDLPLVEAPSTWEATVCQRSGIDYEELRTKQLAALPGGGDGDGAPNAGENFADAFLGDYVTKLEQVVESYRLVNNFHEGNDTVVASLRDDVFNTRASCDVESPNRFHWASNLEPRLFTPADPQRIGWTQTGCETEPVESEAGRFERPIGPCIVVRPRDDSPVFAPFIGEPPVPAYDVEFGHPDWCDETCAYEEGAALAQTLELPPGRYRLSWYTTDGEGAGGMNAARVRHADGSEFPVVFPRDSQGEPERGFIEGLDDDWNRVFFEFDVFATEEVTVGFERPSVTDYSVPLAAPMLERLEDPLHTRTLPEPRRFTDTTDELKAYLPVCEDATGVNFRAQKWDRNCVKLCPDGYSSNCVEQTRTECFWETSFNVSQRSIEAGHMFNQSGFARGNFNYRIRSIGLNFVGTNLRACEESDLPTTCNAAGFIPYSILHAGPYNVRNHKGQDYRVALFPGRIEHARGLGIERYITNPISESDRSLLTPYLRTELNGRPLDGEFILRVWDEPGVNFNAIQDVQLIIDYGYWTRFN